MSLWLTLTAMSRNGQQQGYVVAWMYTARGEGVLPYMAYTGMCHWTGYGFRPLCPKQGI